ncbi:hypothetical protein ACS0TY_006075 [Phlomoides rotata]
MEVDPMEILYDAAPPNIEEPEEGGDYIDRATDLVAEDVVEAAKCLKLLYGRHSPIVEEQECDGANYRSGGDQQPPSGGLYDTQVNDPTEVNITPNGGNNMDRDPTRGGKRKRKLNLDSTGPSNIKCLLREFCCTTGERLATIVGRIGYEHDLGNVRKLLFEQLDVIPGLSIKEKLKTYILMEGRWNILKYGLLFQMKQDQSMSMRYWV